jgi:predicted unusual protein kinase regulating ubiquinone biosynthesis (AarF/ABC1/UbiB family)
VALALSPHRVGKYRDLARLLVKYGGSDLVRQAGLHDMADPLPVDNSALDPAAATPPPDALALARDLEQMGPTYVKLGQLLSTRTDLIPAEYAAALARLQDRVEPLAFAEVRQVLDEELAGRGGVDRVFAQLDQRPLASASLGQVHRGRLADGHEVAVKVQRPGARDAVADDMDVLVDIAGLLDRHTEAARRYGVLGLVEYFRRSIFAELDYRQEAANLTALGRILQPYPRLTVPRPYDDLTTERVLVMELVDGRKITEVDPAALAADGPDMARDLFRAYLDQILVEGFFHADPHPGNVLVVGHRLALVDLGMVATIGPSVRDHLVRLLLAVAENDAQRAAAAVGSMSEKLDDFDQAAFTRAVGAILDQNRHRSVERIAAGGVVLAVSKASYDAGLRPAPELSMLGKALLNLDQVARILDPSFDPTEALKDHAQDVLQERLRPSGASLMSAALEMKEFVERLPARVNDVLDSAASGSFELKVRAFDEAEMLRGLQKLANRVTMGLLLAALIVGAAMLMRVPTASHLFGYPALAIVCFLAAAVGAGLLLVSIVWSDRRTKKRL